MDKLIFFLKQYGYEGWHLILNSDNATQEEKQKILDELKEALREFVKFE